MFLALQTLDNHVGGHRFEKPRGTEKALLDLKQYGNDYKDWMRCVTHLFRFLFLTVSPNLKDLRLKAITEQFCSVRCLKISSRLGPSHESLRQDLVLNLRSAVFCLLQLPDAVAECAVKVGPPPSRCRYREKNPRDSEEVAGTRHGSDPPISARGVRARDQEAGAGEARILGLGRRRAALRGEDQVLQQRQLQDHEEGRRSLWEGVSVSTLKGSVVEISHLKRFPGIREIDCQPNHFYIELGCVIPAKPTCAAFTQPCGSLHILCTSSWRNISSMFSS